MLNTIACIAVNEMVQLLFEYYGDIQSRSHFFPTKYYKNENNYTFHYLTVVLYALFSCTYSVAQKCKSVHDNADWHYE